MDGQNIQNNNFQQPAPKQTNVLAIISLVLGILAIILGCCSGWIGVILGVGGIVCAVLANKQGKTGLATGGLVCSIIGVILGILVIVLAGAALAFFQEMGIEYPYY